MPIANDWGELTARGVLNFAKKLRWYLEFNGISYARKSSNISIITGDVVKINYLQKGLNSYNVGIGLIDSLFSSGRSFVGTGANSKFEYIESSWSSAYLDGVLSTGNSTLLSTLNTPHEVVLTAAKNINFGVIGDDYSGNNAFIGFIYDITIERGGTIIHSIAIDEPYAEVPKFFDSISGDYFDGYNMSEDNFKQDII